MKNPKILLFLKKVETPSEILDEVHYYPNGLKMEGYWMNSDKFRYTFNSIEEIDDFGLNVNRATFRTLDPELGRWWSVDPQATTLMSMNPYNSMANSPLVHNDPNGDVLPAVAVAAIAGGVIGGAINVATHWDDITASGFSWSAFGKAAGVGAVAGTAAVMGGAAFTAGAAASGISIGGYTLGTTGAISGAVGGAASYPIKAIGNHAPRSFRRYRKETAYLFFGYVFFYKKLFKL